MKMTRLRCSKLLLTCAVVAYAGIQGIEAQTCGALESCGNCVLQPECGWCSRRSGAGGSICVPGNTKGPNNDVSSSNDASSEADEEKNMMAQLGCEEYHFSNCPAVVECSAYRSCTKCIADPFCGWCASTNTCADGVENGVIAGLGNGCSAGYAFAPKMPANDHLAFQSLVASSASVLRTQREANYRVCQEASKEGAEHLREMIDHQTEVNETLRSINERCAPCAGTWPACDCDGNVDESYLAGDVSVSWNSDEAIRASVTGGEFSSTEDIPTPEDSALRACEALVRTASDAVAETSKEYLRLLARKASLRREFDENIGKGILSEINTAKRRLREAQAKEDAAKVACEGLGPKATREDVAAADRHASMLATKLRAVLESGQGVEDAQAVSELQRSLTNATRHANDLRAALNVSAADSVRGAAVNGSASLRFRRASSLLREN